MFIAKNIVRMHDTDMAGILYFPRQFRFMHDAFEDLLAQEGFDFEKLFKKLSYAFVVVHAESDYLFPLKVGDKLLVHIKTQTIGKTSFTMEYHIYKEDDNTLVGQGKTVHVTINKEKWQKIPIPSEWKEVLLKYQNGQGSG